MVLYMLLFVSALKGKQSATSLSRSGSKQSYSQPLLREGDTSSHASIDHQDFSPMAYNSGDPHFATSGRGKSFTEIVENIANHLSLSAQAEEFQDGNDEMTPLRTMSVA